MPKDDKRSKELTQEEINAQNEKFRTFFSTSVAQVPQEMKRRDEEQAKEASNGLLGRIFRREKTGQAEQEASAAPQTGEHTELPPTGEIVLGREEETEADLELALDPAAPEETEQEPVRLPQTAMPEPEAPAVEEPPKPSAPARAAAKPAPKPEKHKPRREPLTPQEQKEDEEMAELKAMLFGRPAKPAAPARPAPVEEVRSAPQEVLGVEPEPPAAPEPPQKPVIPMVFAEDQTVKAAPEPEPEIIPGSGAETPEQAPAFHFFGKGEDEAAPKAPARPEAPGMDDSMSLPLLGLEEEPAAAAPAQTPQPAPEAPAEEAKPEPQPEEAEAPAEPETPEQVGERLHKMSAELTLRCVLGGILAVVLLHFGLVAAGLLAPVAGLDPEVAPAAFYAANLLFLAAALAVGWPVLRDGLAGLRGRPSADTMPALAACGAALQAAVALFYANSYQASSWTLLSGVAALGLFLALLGSRVLLAAVRNGYQLAEKAPEGLQGAFRVRDKDLIRVLARGLDQKDPWVLLSRPVQWDESLVEQSFGERASERRSRKTSYLLLGAAVLSGLAFLLFGGGINGMAAAFTAMLCMGAPLSSTLIAGIASLRLQKTAAAAGAVVPGWAAIEELGGVDTVQVDADELFAPDSVDLEDIRIFKGGRIDRAILYAASILNQSCDTLRGLFRQIIEDRTEILYPVKDLEIHHGLGFSAWCDNNRVLIGSRLYMEREGVPLPDREYEDEHSQKGALQILYLAVSGSLHAMFVLRTVGGRNTARGLEVLQRENIRLLVTCKDPSLTARHITEAYHLPEGMIALLDQEQCAALDAAPAQPEDAARCCMLHDKGFASLIGGLHAAEQAQNAETSATTVQLVSVWFSVAIGVLLTYAGSIGTLSVAVVLMYQAAWSALSIAVCALKQHN